jgi:diadenosine tetraphosphate (Ap4A) HIT family hydrolase
MPRRISKEEAIARALAEREQEGCLVCALLAGRAGPMYLLHQGVHARALLSRYPRNWGQALILIETHTTRFSELDPEVWREANELAYAVARRLEQTLSPIRCFVTCLGTARTDLPMSSPHIHLHVDPVYDPDERPSTVLTLEHGALEAEPEEWEALRALLAW